MRTHDIISKKILFEQVQDTTVVLSGSINEAAFTDVAKCYGDGESVPNSYMAGTVSINCRQILCKHLQSISKFVT